MLGQVNTDLLHVSDVAEALCLISQNNHTGSINIGSGEPLLIRKLVEKIAEICSGDAEELLQIPPFAA